MDRLFGLDMQLLMDALQFGVSVFVLFLLASYLFLNPVRKTLKERQDGIKKSIEDAAVGKEAAEELKLLYEKKLENVDRQAEEILSIAHQKALKNEVKIIDRAKKEAGRMVEKGSYEAKQEKKRMLDEMKQEIITIASMMAAKAAEAAMDSSMQDRFVEETLKEMESSLWQS